MPDGLRICREMILEEFLENSDGFLKMLEVLKEELNIGQKELMMICIQAAAEGSPEFRARILKHFSQ